jgi:hypothetical protein
MSDPVGNFIGGEIWSIVKGIIEKNVQTDLVDKGLLTQQQSGTFVAGIELDIQVALELMPKPQS